MNCSSEFYTVPGAHALWLACFLGTMFVKLLLSYNLFQGALEVSGSNHPALAKKLGKFPIRLAERRAVTSEAADLEAGLFQAPGEMQIQISSFFSVGQFEQELIRNALAQTQNNQTRAAELLGTTRRILKYKMDKLGIGSDDSRG